MCAGYTKNGGTNIVGSLRAGATYIYERVDDVIYAREMGAPANERFEVGYNYQNGTAVDKLFGKPLDELAKLVDMVNAAEQNPALQDALDRVRVLYELTREHKS